MVYLCHTSVVIFLETFVIYLSLYPFRDLKKKHETKRNVHLYVIISIEKIGPNLLLYYTGG